MSQKKNLNSAEKPLQVKFYSGYKSQETPRSIIIEGMEHVIRKIKERKRILNSETGEIFNQFVCQTDKNIFVIKVPENQEKNKLEVYEKPKK
ncbi:MAG: hypothetical protein ACOC5S_00670 [Acidobacteriota bacterium]